MRIEKDSLGELELEDVYYGIHSKRAIGNFQIRGRRVNKELLRAIGLIKICSAEANKKAGIYDGAYKAVELAAAESR